MLKRAVNLSKTHSFFLFGARGTGKTTLLEEQFSRSFKDGEIFWVDLLDPEKERELTLRPMGLLEEICGLKVKPKFVVIDEIQKVPKLLDVVHKGIQKYKLMFALTGSSARKLKRGSANLLAGRAFNFKIHPLTSMELGAKFQLDRVLKWGSLPEIFYFDNDTDRKRYLKSYVQTYLKEEILVEQLVRNIEPFRYFLDVVGQTNGTILNYSKVGRDAGIDSKSCERYFEILSDTLVGFFLEAFESSIRKRLSKRPKFYFFDIGVARALSGQIDAEISSQTFSYGNAFEHFVILEIMRLNDYFESGYKMSYLRTKDDVEIDLVLQKGRDLTLIEVKSTEHVQDRHLKPLLTIGSEFEKSRRYLFSRQKKRAVQQGVTVCHWEDGLRSIFPNAKVF